VLMLESVRSQFAATQFKTPAQLPSPSHRCRRHDRQSISTIANHARNTGLGNSSSCKLRKGSSGETFAACRKTTFLGAASSRGCRTQYRRLWGRPRMVHALSVPAVCGGRSALREGPRPSLASCSWRRWSSDSERVLERKECSSRNNSLMNHSPRAFIVHGWR